MLIKSVAKCCQPPPSVPSYLEIIELSHTECRLVLELKNVTEKPLPPLSDAYDTCASERATQHNRRRRTNGDARERALLATYVHRLVNVTDKVRDERQGARLGRGAGGADARLDRGAALVEDRRVVEDRRHDAAVVARWEHLEEGRVVCAIAAIVQSLGYGGELCRGRAHVPGKST